MNDRDKLLRRLQIASFALVEAQLFLDTHPGDKKALEYFKKAQYTKNTLTDEYSAKYTPLTQASVDVKNGWNWINCPWPWQTEV